MSSPARGPAPRRRVSPPIGPRAAACLIACASALGCGGDEAPPSAPVEAPPAAQGQLPELEHVDVTLFFPAEGAEGLVPETRSVVKTTEPNALARQVLTELIAGPQRAGGLRAVPEGTSLRQIYLTGDGTAYADFGGELRARLGGGSAAEIAAAYAIVHALAANVPGVRRVAILLDGQQVDTLNGHLDLTRPLSPRRDLVEGRPAASGAGGA